MQVVAALDDDADGEAQPELDGRDAWAEAEADPQPAAGGDASGNTRTAAFNSRNRRVASGWFAGLSEGRLMLLRLIMEPLRRLLRNLLVVASEDWDLRQQSQAAERSLQGREPKRAFRVTVAASCSLEDECAAKAFQLLHNEEIWSVLPSDSLVESEALLAFKMLSQLVCSLHEKVRAPHQETPTSIFGLLDDPDAAGRLAAIPECLLDSWSKDFLAKHAGGLTSKKALAILATLAHLTYKDISGVECRHAAIRRWLVSRSVQTHVMDFRHLSCEWVLQRARKLSLLFQGSRVASAGQGVKRTASGAPKPTRGTRRTGTRQARGGGGGQRAYISQQLRVRRLRYPTPGVARMLNAEYSALADDEKADYKRRGRVATMMWKKLRKVVTPH